MENKHKALQFAKEFFKGRGYDAQTFALPESLWLVICTAADKHTAMHTANLEARLKEKEEELKNKVLLLSKRCGYVDHRVMERWRELEGENETLKKAAEGLVEALQKIYDICDPQEAHGDFYYIADEALTNYKNLINGK